MLKDPVVPATGDQVPAQRVPRHTTNKISVLFRLIPTEQQIETLQATPTHNRPHPHPHTHTHTLYRHTTQAGVDFFKQLTISLSQL